MNGDSIPLYVGIPLVIFLIGAAVLMVALGRAIWKDK